MMTRDYLHTEILLCASSATRPLWLSTFNSCFKAQLSSCLQRSCDPWYGPRFELQSPYNFFVTEAVARAQTGTRLLVGGSHMTKKLWLQKIST